MIAVFVDWGSTNFRAYLVELRCQIEGSARPKLCVLDSVATGRGVLTIEQGQFADVLEETLAPWSLPAGTLVLLAGMAGSQLGWRETPYVPTPVSIHQLSHGLLSVPSRFDWHVEFVPGIRYDGQRYDSQDVMRGEEVLALGSEIENGIVCLPGTHSKWLTLSQGEVASFKTFMTGELYQLLTAHSSLQSVTSELGFVPQAFNDGVSKKGHLSNELFGVRAKVLTGHMDLADGASYLSGLLIGQEFDYFLDQQAQMNLTGLAGRLYIVSEGVLLNRYQQACEYFELDYQLVDSEQCFIHGMYQLVLARGNVS